MKKTRVISLLLSLLVTMSLCAPALAEGESMDSELQRVTLAVKKTLSVSDAYTQFSGDVNDMGALRYWSLDWSDDAGAFISVTATDVGKVMQYRAGGAEESGSRLGGFAPVLHAADAAQALSAGEAFVARVLTAGETAKLSGDKAPSLYSGSYSLTGELALNGVPTSNVVRLQVDAASGQVSSFWRTDQYSAYVSAVPSAVPAVNASAANQALSGAVKLTLQYVSDGKDTAAVLRYVPSVNDGLYVDAQTGKLTDLADAWANVEYGAGGKGAAAPEAAADANSTATSGTLSDAEQAAISQLTGVLSRDALDAAARKLTALGLSRYTLAAATYRRDADSGDVSCTLRYNRALAYSELTGVDSADFKAGKYQLSRVLTVDAKTGALRECWTYRPWCMKTVTADRTKLQPAADSFLASWKPEYASQTALTEGGDGAFTYDRKVNGYFYHDNYATVGIDPADGSVESCSFHWDDALRFAAPGTPISQTAALTAFTAACGAQLRYISYPVRVDSSIPIWATYENCCGSVAYRYVLGYTYVCAGEPVLGVDAATGALVRAEAPAAASVYTDLAGSFARKQIEALAACGIGFGSAAEFRPAAALTEGELLVLLLNADGWSYDAAELGEADMLESLYSSAWQEGFVPRGQKNPGRAVTRLELVKAILSASPYGPAAGLTGIYRVSFADAAQIPAADLGYAALAQGLGMVRGDRAGRFQPTRIATRQEAAAILYNYMSR